MRQVLNTQTFLWLVGVLQPAGALELRNYLCEGLDDKDIVPDIDNIHSFLMKQAKMGRIIRVAREPDLFSLTEFGNEVLSKRHRLARDKARLFLLKELRSDRIVLSREVDATGSVGDSPSLDARPHIKGAATNKIVRSSPPGQFYWSLLSKQFSDETGLLQASRDTLYPSYCSFYSEKQLRLAEGKLSEARHWRYMTLGLMLGISPRLIVQIARKPDRHYRSFELPKKSGGTRPIDSPRTFLKTLQYFLNDYFLSGLTVHDAVTSYRAGIGIQENAKHHSKKPFVANIDIENFFGSITTDMVCNLLRNEGYDSQFAHIASRICTKGGTLPQGSPTSPAISNAMIKSFDFEFSRICAEQEFTYTRYADDITISGNYAEQLDSLITICERLLSQGYGLRLNNAKLRISSARSQQRVTGLVVNEGVRPPREWRRKVRSAFHKASLADVIDQKTYVRLCGFISYLSAFDQLKDSVELVKYRQILDAVSIRKNS